MKKLFILILAAVTLTSCMSNRYFTKHKDEICSQCPEKIVEKHDSIFTQRIDTIYRIHSVDSLIIAAGIFQNMPAGVTTDTIRIVDKVYDVSVWLENSRLKASIQHLNDTIDKIIVSNNSTANNQDAKVQTITKTVIKKAGRFYVWYFWTSAIAIIICIILKLWLGKFVKGLNELMR